MNASPAVLIMDPTAQRILSASRAAAQMGEHTVTIDVAGIPVTIAPSFPASPGTATILVAPSGILPDPTPTLQ